VLYGDGGEMDHLALMAVADIEEFWKGAYGAPLKDKFKPVNAVFSYDSRYKNGTFCGSATQDNPNLYYCGSDRLNCPNADPKQCTSSLRTIGWDRSVYLPRDRDTFGVITIALDLAHEYGHAIQHMAALVHESDPIIRGLVKEQQADCFSGVYLRWVADGKSSRFTMNTGETLDKMLASQISVRDPLLGESDPDVMENDHGSAFERVTAFQMGFAPDGITTCASIDGKEIARRRGELPPDLLKQGQTGEVLVSEKSVQALFEALVKMLSPASEPKLAFDQPPCPDAKPNGPARYCPSTNTIAVDINRLIVMGTSLTRGSAMVSTFATPLFGDYSPYSVLASRMMLAAQKERGLPLDNTDAGLRTACLTGAITKRLSTEGVMNVTGGDLDEAVTGVLLNGQVASNVKGEYAPSGFARVNAFRTGVLGDEKNCYEQWK
jgi:predicted metalloprotease